MGKEKNNNNLGIKNKVTLDQQTGEIEADKPLSAYTKNDDALNQALNQMGQGIGTHEVDVNEQTDLELGALADPGGMDPAMDDDYLENMKDDLEFRRT